MNTNEIIYIDADMIGTNCTFEQAQEVAEKLTGAGYPSQAFDTCGATPRGYASVDDIPQEIWLKVIAEVFVDDAPDGIKTVDSLLEWGDSYDGDLPELNQDDYDSDDELEQAEEQRRRQYWRLTGTIAISRAAWEAWLNRNGVDRESEYWTDAEKIADRFRALMDEAYWPIDCHLSYERGDGYSDEYDTIEGAGHYSIIDL